MEHKDLFFFNLMLGDEFSSFYILRMRASDAIMVLKILQRIFHWAIINSGGP